MTSELIDSQHAHVTPRSVGPRGRTRSLLACALLALAGSVAHAADSHRHNYSDVVTEIYDGTWTATFEPGVGPTGTARLVLKDFAGTWTDIGPASRLKASVCGGKPMPVTVQMSQKEEFGFTVFGVSVSPECPDLTIALERVDENTLEGIVESRLTSGEKKIKLVRAMPARKKR